MAKVGLRVMTIQCSDLEKSRQFYETIGLELHKFTHEWSGKYYYFSKLEGNLTFNILLAEPGREFDRNGLDFQVDNVNDLIARLTEIGVRIIAPYRAMLHVCNHLVVEDPDGRKIRLVNKG